MATAVHDDEEVIWATSTTGDDFQCVHVADWLKAKARLALYEQALKIIAGRQQCVDNLMSDKAVAAAALDQQ